MRFHSLNVAVETNSINSSTFRQEKEHDIFCPEDDLKLEKKLNALGKFY